MALPIWTVLYRRFGPRYPTIFVILELLTAFGITAATLGLFTFFYRAPTSDYLKTLAAVEFLTFLGVSLTLKRTLPRLEPIRNWIAGDRSDEATAHAWSTAVSLPLNLIKTDVKIPTLVVVLPGCVVATAFLGLTWFNYFPLVAGSFIALGYSAILHYLAVESGMRPVLVDINQEVSPRLSTRVRAVSLRTRMLVVLPVINVVSGFIVAALTSHGGGISGDVLVAVGIAGAISLELTVLLTHSILSPIADLRGATEAVARGDFETAVAVTTGDELGELAASFNLMVKGLAERKQIREAFGTYLDASVAEILLAGNYPRDGVEVDVSLLFFDVRDFTHFAAEAEAREVIGKLNELFELTVPIINRHGGHVDKFMGDGLMAIFGAPENYRDHADRAVRAAYEMARRVNRDENLGLEIGIGINSGKVAAGSIGGGGRLNFSVIGDAVNVAARVESETKELGDAVLISEETAGRLSPGISIERRGTHRLKGIDRKVGLYAVVLDEAVGIGVGEEPLEPGHTPELGERGTVDASLGSPPERNDGVGSRQLGGVGRL
jgi:class 3 adenylate cyclase